MGRPAPISATNRTVRRRRRSSLASAERVSTLGRRPPTRMTACCLLFLALWAVLSVSVSSATSAVGMGSDAELDSELLETETGWRFFNDDDDEGSIQTFDNSSAPAPAPASSAKLPSGQVALINGDFEQTNVTSNATTLADATATTMIPNWLPGGAGVQVIQSSTYKMSTFTKSSLFAIHLNNPASTANGTQGLIATTLAVNPASGKQFTVQYDCARMPDGPINLLSALKVSSISGTTTNSYQLHHVKYNATDTLTQITWQRQSFVYSGTGATTKIQFESMSEKYGPAIDNVVILTGSHVLAAAPRAHLPALWQLLATVVLVVVFQSPLSQLL